MRIAETLLAASFLAVGSSWAQVSPSPGSDPCDVSGTAAADSAAPAAGTAAPPSPALSDPSTAADLAAARAATPEPASTTTAVGPRRPGDRAGSEVTIDRRTAVVAGVRFGGPVGAAVRLSLLHGLGADVREKDERVDAVCSVPIPHCAGGFLLDAEAGSGGGKLSLGLGANAKVQSEDFKGTVGAGLKLSLARTWGAPVGTDPGLTYLGPELDLYVLRVGVNLGVLWRVAGSGGSSALFSWGLGLRL
jgi:hypothetical protein